MLNTPSISSAISGRSMIDTILNFTTAAAARADPVLSAHMDDLHQWVGSYVFPNIQTWRVSQDHSVGNDPETGLPMIAHTYRTGWSLLICWPTILQPLLNHPNLIVMIDRSKVITNQTGMIIKANVTNPVMQDTRWEPVPMGVEYPWGNWK